MLAANGHKPVIAKNGVRTSTRLGEPVKLKPGGEWNDYHISAGGNRIVLKINGRISVEVIDRESKFFKAKGVLGLQLRCGPPMKVQFKEIYLKQLSASPRKGSTALVRGLACWKGQLQQFQPRCQRDEPEGHFDEWIPDPLTREVSDRRIHRRFYQSAAWRSPSIAS